MFRINLQRPTKVTSPLEVEPYVAVLKKREFNNPLAYYFEEEFEMPGFFPFRLSKAIVGSAKVPLSRGFGELVLLNGTGMTSEYSHIASISIGAKNQENQSIVAGLHEEQVPITTNEAQIARLAIGQALYNIVEGEPSLTIPPIDDTRLITSLREEFTGTV